MTHGKKSIRFTYTPRRRTKRFDVEALNRELARPYYPNPQKCSRCGFPFSLDRVEQLRATRIPESRWLCYSCLDRRRAELQGRYGGNWRRAWSEGK